MLFKRTIILCNKNKDNDNAIAFVNIQKDDRKTRAILKCYNLQNFNNVQFGLCEDENQIIKTKFDAKNNETVFDINSNLNIEGNLGCIIVSETNGEIRPLLWGKNDCLDTLFPTKAVSRDSQGRFISQNKESLFDSPTDSELNEMISKELEKDNISKVSNIKEVDDDSEDSANDSYNEKNNDKIKEDNTTFYSLISDQVEELFQKYPQEEKLQELIPHSKWVKVDYEGNGKEYTVGLIYDGDVLKYLAYGVPSSKTAEVQEEIRDYSQWVPLDPTSIDGRGFWIMYQDAITGDSVNISSDDTNFA